MKKITIITMQLKTPGGIERYITTLTEIFSQNFEVEIICNYGKLSDKLAFKLPKNTKLIFLTADKPAEISMKNLILNFKWHKIPAELRRRINITKTRNFVFEKALKNLNTDFIITERALYSSLVKKYYHGPAIKIATDHNYHQNQQKYINELINSVQGFDYLILPTDELKNFYTPKLPNLKCLCISPALNNIPTKKSNLEIKNLLSVGRLVPEKDFAILVDAMAIIHQQAPDIKLTIIGDGPGKPQLAATIHNLGLSDVISIIGPLSHQEMTPYYYNCSLFVSTSKTEAFGLAITEAMSYGLPCVAFSRASGARAQLPSGGINLVDDYTAASFAKTVLDSLRDYNELRSKQLIMQSYIENNFSKSAVEKKWRKILS